MPRFIADLHAHTRYSDGRYAPEELAERIANAGLRGFAVTDHDTVAGLMEAGSAAAERGLEFVPGIEMSTQVGGSEIHMLGYCFDTADPGIAGYTATVEQRRRDRAAAIVGRLNELGVPVRMDDVAEIAGEGSIGRPHVAMALVRGGWVSSIAEAFTRYIRDGGPAFVATEKVSASEAIEMIHDAGGVAVIAHPGHVIRHAVLLELIRGGLDGIEVRHPSHGGWLVEYYGALAHDFSLLRTGGSDFHGHRDDEEKQLGRFGVTADEFSSLRAAHERRRN